MEAVVCASTLEELRRYVHEALCARDKLDVLQTPLQEMVFSRAGRPCALFFHIQGPRLLKNYALWVGEENRILFYDSAGVRYREVQLSEAPDPARLAA